MDDGSRLSSIVYRQRPERFCDSMHLAPSLRALDVLVRIWQLDSAGPIKSLERLFA